MVTCMRLGSLALVLSVLGTVASAADITPGPWSTDRFAPHSAVYDAGTNSMTLTINGSEVQSNNFYNTQGLQQAASVLAPWSVSADLLLDRTFNSTKVRTDLWARDNNLVENLSNYPILGILNDGTGLKLRAWDSQLGWSDIAGGLTADGLKHNFRIESTGSEFDFYFDNNKVFTDATYSQSGSTSLQTVFLEAYNFGTNDYSVQWSNVQVSDVVGGAAIAPVPVPAALYAASPLLGMLGLYGWRKRKRHRPETLTHAPGGNSGTRNWH